MMDFDELARRNQCRRRYGRATVTILRSAGWSEFMFAPQLALAVAEFERGAATPESVCWAFVRSRVESHSPTFNWKSAKLDRILPLVCNCSTSPRLPSSEPLRVADALVSHRHALEEERRALVAPLTTSIARAQHAIASAVSTSAFRTISEIAAAQSRQIEAIMKAAQPAIMQSSQLRLSLARFAESLPKVTPPSLPARMFQAAWAAEIQPVVAEAAEVVDRPTATNVMPILQELVERMEGLEVDAQERAEGEEERAELERKRFIFQVYLALYLFLITLILTAPPPPQ